MTATLQKRAVAGSFIFRFPEGDADGRPEVALFRRSGAVRTYQHMYAPISGSIEESDADPLATAWRELGEETGLTAASLRLFRQGKPYSFVDEAVGREWTIHPFGFRLKAGSEDAAAMKLDWEHEGYAWFDPADVSDDEAFGGVPRLRESLRRVWFELDLGEAAAAVLRRGLDGLRDDRESGARQLASKALDVLVDVVPKLDAASAERWWSNVRRAGWHLWKNGREAMGAPVLAAVLSCLAVIEGKMATCPVGRGALPVGFVDDVVVALMDLARQRCEPSARMLDAFCALLRRQQPPDNQPVHVLTLSSSSTVAAGLMHALAQGIPVHTHVLESRPLFEGVAMARAIAASAPDPRVSVHTDASAALAARDARVVVVGADLIDAHANICNKTGSLPAVLAARHVSPAVAVVALADKDKVLPFAPPGREDNDPAEVSRAWGCDATARDAIDVRNSYFEWVSAGLIDHYVTEDGVTTAEEIAAWAEDVRRRADHFSDHV